MNTAQLRRPRIVLLVENELETLHALAHSLEQGGYTVIRASTPHEAEEYVRLAWFHLGVFDARLEDNANELDFAGVTLTLSQEICTYPRIIYTNYEPETARKLLREYFGRLPQEVSLYSKQEHPDLVKVVDEAFGDLAAGRPGIVHINFDQRLEGLSRLLMAEALNPELWNDESQLIERGRELEDLFSKAFFDYERLKIEQLQHRGRGGSLILLVTPEKDGIARAPLLVKCGLRTSIRREYDNYRNHAKEFVPAHIPQSADEKDYETRHFGLIKYRLVGGRIDADKVLTFADFYDEQDDALITRAVEHVFRLMEPWYLNTRPSTERPSLPSYQTRFYEQRLIFRRHSNLLDRVDEWAQVGQVVQRLIDGPTPRLKLRRLDRSRLHWQTAWIDMVLPDPYAYLSSIRERPSAHFQKTYDVCICHGDLHETNVLVDDQGRPWLIDFEFTDWGPVLQDAVELESVVRFRLLFERQLDRLLMLEQALAGQQDFDGPVELPEQLRGADSGESHKAVAVVRAIRREAGRIEAARLPDYYLGLIYQALREILNESPSAQTDPHLRRRHRTRIQALFSASLYCARLMAAGGKADKREQVLV